MQYLIDSNRQGSSYLVGLSNLLKELIYLDWYTLRLFHSILMFICIALQSSSVESILTFFERQSYL